MPNRIAQEKSIVSKMISIYCRNHHSTAQLCPDCAALEAYAHHRLDRCRYGNQKPTCSRCRTHCYNPQMRQQIKATMRYSGKRMLLHSPLAALTHLLRTLH